jgi:type I restriction enzyme M protein
VLFGSSQAHKELRRMLVEEHKLDAVISLPSGVFRPYAGVLDRHPLLHQDDVGGTDYVWFYDMQADGWSLDDKRQPLLSEAKLGTCAGGGLERGRARQEQPSRRTGRWNRREGTELADRERRRASACARLISPKTARTSYR